VELLHRGLGAWPASRAQGIDVQTAMGCFREASGSPRSPEAVRRFSSAPRPPEAGGAVRAGAGAQAVSLDEQADAMERAEGGSVIASATSTDPRVDIHWEMVDPAPTRSHPQPFTGSFSTRSGCGGAGAATLIGAVTGSPLEGRSSTGLLPATNTGRRASTSRAHPHPARHRVAPVPKTPKPVISRAT